MTLQTPSQKTAATPPVRRRMVATQGHQADHDEGGAGDELITSPIKRAWACGSRGISRGLRLKQNNAAQHALLRGSRSRCLCCRNRSEKPVHNVLTGFSRSFISCARRRATAPDWSVTRHASTNGVRGNYRLLPPRRSVLVAASLVESFRNTGWPFLGQVAGDQCRKPAGQE